MSGVSSAVFPSAVVFTNYLAHVLISSSLTGWTENGRYSFVGSIENLVCDCMLYSHSPVLYDLSTGWRLLRLSPQLHFIPTCPLWILPIRFRGIVAFFILYASL